MQSEFIRSNCHDAPVVKALLWNHAQRDSLHIEITVVCVACGEIMGVITPTSQFEKDALRFRYLWMLTGSFPTPRKISDFVRRINEV